MIPEVAIFFNPIFVVIFLAVYTGSLCSRYTILETSHVQSYVMTVFLVSPHKLYSTLFAVAENPYRKLDPSSLLLLLDEEKKYSNGHSWVQTKDMPGATVRLHVLATEAPLQTGSSRLHLLASKSSALGIFVAFPMMVLNSCVELTVNDFPPFTFAIPLMIL